MIKAIVIVLLFSSAFFVGDFFEYQGWPTDQMERFRSECYGR